MSTLRFSVELISPMFLRGPDNETPELRPPSFKGVLRYWWRAAKVLPVSQLHEEEGRIFGSATGEGGVQSTVQVRFSQPHLTDSSHQPVPHKGYRTRGFDPAQSFDIVLRRKPQCPASMQEIRDTAFLALQLGGLGYRSRRGFGALRITSIDDAPHELGSEPLRPVFEALSRLNGDFAYDRAVQEGETSSITYRGGQHPPYPWIESIEVSEFYYSLDPNDDYNRDALLEGISKATSKHNSPYTGWPNRPRLASPIAVTLQADEHGCWPVVTTLHLPESTERKLQNKRDTRSALRDAALNVY